MAGESAKRSAFVFNVLLSSIYVLVDVSPETVFNCAAHAGE